jgi:hypothetical protein
MSVDGTNTSGLLDSFVHRRWCENDARFGSVKSGGLRPSPVLLLGILLPLELENWGASRWVKKHAFWAHQTDSKGRGVSKGVS